MRRPALAILAALAMVEPAQAGFTVTAPNPDTPQHMHARGATLFDTLATKCPQFFPLDVAYMRKRQAENFGRGLALPGFSEVYDRVALERAREVAEMGVAQWCRATRALMLERGLQHLFPPEPKPPPPTYKRIESVEESTSIAVFMGAIKVYCPSADTAKALALQQEALADAMRDHGEAATRTEVERRGIALDRKIRDEGPRQWCDRQRRELDARGLNLFP